MAGEEPSIAPGALPPRPLCFVLMPFGRKTDGAGRLIDFDAVYQQIIAPGIEAAGMDAIRADEERVGGTIHKPMFERLMLCDYAVADLTGANANVYYELGIRHSIRPQTTVIVFAEGTSLPFDLALVRGMPYQTDQAGKPTSPAVHAAMIADGLRHAHANLSVDSPIFQLVEGMPEIKVDHSKTDVFRELADYSKAYKERLGVARLRGADAVRKIASESALDNLRNVESGVIIDLYLAFRDVKAHQEMLDLYERMPKPLQQARMVQEQLGFALNRLSRSEEAERVLKAVIEKSGPSSETNGLLGRVYKDRWEAAKKAGRFEARGFLKLAVDTYLAGFEADWRDPYPGVNAVTLMEMQDKVDPRQARVLPVVRYAAEQRARIDNDYWAYATLFELAVLSRDPDDSFAALATALALADASWKVETTAQNIRRIREARTARKEEVDWMQEVEAGLAEAQARLEAPREVTA